MHENVKSKPPTVQKVFNMNHEHKKHIIISFIMFAVITIARLFLWGDRESIKKLKNIFRHPGFLIGFILAASWSIFILGFGGAKTFTDDTAIYNSYIEATKKAILAIFIAIFAKIELIIPVFWLVWLTAFYLEGWS
jgi:hypothetical protein